MPRAKNWRRPGRSSASLSNAGAGSGVGVADRAATGAEAPTPALERPPVPVSIALAEPTNRWLVLAAGVAVVLAAGAIYVATAARDIVVGDTSELVIAALTLGVPHAPGYPLLTMLGHLFSLLPVGPEPSSPRW